MSFKRPEPEAIPRFRSHSDSSSSLLRPSKRARLGSTERTMPNVKIYIVQAKIDPSSLSELFMLAERHAERLCFDAEEADVIITAIRMRRRFERHVPWNMAVSILFNVEWTNRKLTHDVFS